MGLQQGQLQVHPCSSHATLCYARTHLALHTNADECFGCQSGLLTFNRGPCECYCLLALVNLCLHSSRILSVGGSFKVDGKASAAAIECLPDFLRLNISTLNQEEGTQFRPDKSVGNCKWRMPCTRSTREPAE